MMSLPRYKSYGKELMLFPRHNKVIAIYNRTMSVLVVGLQGIVKKAVGLAG
jgi:hypothetical protein